MLIDWLTFRISLADLPQETREAAMLLNDQMIRMCPKTGEIKKKHGCWETLRSDSHQVNAFVGSDLKIQGSPARAIGNGCNVFSSGPAAALDIYGCMERMINIVQDLLDAPLPDPHKWTLTRIDVTFNLFLPSLPDVRVALSHLRNCEGGRYKVSSKQGDSVYWNESSRLRKGKAYAKGPQLESQSRKRNYTGYIQTDKEMKLSQHILRLELTLGREFFRRLDWKQLQPEDLQSQWKTYFDRMIGDADMIDDDKIIQERISDAAPTHGQGQAAYLTWCLIQQRGWEAARNLTTKTTWYRNLKILKSAGFGDADISAGKVVALRRKIMDAQILTGWDHLERLSA